MELSKYRKKRVVLEEKEVLMLIEQELGVPLRFRNLNFHIEDEYFDLDGFHVKFLGLASHAVKRLINQLLRVKMIQKGDTFESISLKIPTALLYENMRLLARMRRINMSRPDLSKIFLAMSKLTQLSYLSVAYFDVECLPEEFGLNSELLELELRYLPIRSLPVSFKLLKKLNRLVLFENAITDLPSVIGELSNLAELQIECKTLASLPPEIGNLSNLKKLLIKCVQIVYLPPEIGKLKNLEECMLSCQRLKELPEEFGNLENLRNFFLYSDEIETLPASIGNLRSLGVLSISCKKLVRLPPTIGLLPKLANLRLVNHALRYLPDEIGDLPSLSMFFLFVNRYIREFPLDLTEKLKNKIMWLVLFSASNASIDVRFSLESLAGLKEIKWLEIKDVSISQLPTAILEWKNLERLRLHKADLSIFPDWLRFHPNIKNLQLSINDDKIENIPADILEWPVKNVCIRRGEVDLQKYKTIGERNSV